MDSKRISKDIGRFLGWLGLSFCSLIVKVMPRAWLYGFANAIASLGYIIAAKQRKIAQEGLNIAFGREKSPQEIKKIAQDCFASMVKSGVELVFLVDRLQLLRSRFQIIGRENLDKAIARNKGVILVSAHFGNFPLMLSRLSLDGYRTAGVMRPMRDQRVEKLFLKKRDKFNIRTIYTVPRRACVEEIIRSLKNNELVFIPLDQNFGTGGIFVDFFGRKAATATGPVILAQRTQASIVPCFIVRQKDNTHKIIFEPALNLEEGSSDEETVMINIQNLTNIIESYIRMYPAEWGWIHRRWKSRPNEVLS